jgi:hypothetical protein
MREVGANGNGISGPDCKSASLVRTPEISGTADRTHMQFLTHCLSIIRDIIYYRHCSYVTVSMHISCVETERSE